jgi:hypothetical protein
MLGAGGSVRYLIGFLLVVTMAAQTVAPKKAVRSKALMACEARADMLLDSSNQLATKNAELEARNTELQKKYTDAIAIMRSLDAETAGRVMTDEETKQLSAVSAGEALNLGISLEKRANDFRTAVTQLAKHDTQAVDHYNALLSDYKDYVNRVNIRLSEISSSYANQQRLNNALAIYSLMPKYSPPSTINLNVTNCNALPALCAGR